MLSATPLDLRDEGGRNPFHWAVACDRREVFDDLLDRGLAVGTEDSLGQTALHVAAPGWPRAD